MNAPVSPETTGTALALKPPSMPMPPEAEVEFGLTTAKWRVLVDQLYPSAKNAEVIMMALSYCQARNLDIFKKPVHIVPMWSSLLKREVETVWPGIAEIRTTAARTGEYAGIDEVIFGPMIEASFGTGNDKKVVKFPEWASVIVYRWVKGEKAAFHTKIFWVETYASIGNTDVPNKMWCKRPHGQFDKCVEAAALRKAFPEELGSTYAAEEMEGRTIDHEPAQARAEPAIARTPPKPPKPPKPLLPGKEPDTTNGDLFAVGRGSFDLEDFLTNLDAAMVEAKSESHLIEIWDHHDVEATLTDDEHGLQSAFDLRKAHLERFGD